jgi:hypothetical protein
MMKFVVCLDNHDYPASLKRGKLYPVLEDAEGAKLGMVRIVDESGEDYLYPAARFAAIAVAHVVLLKPPLAASSCAIANSM